MNLTKSYNLREKPALRENAVESFSLVNKAIGGFGPKIVVIVISDKL
jgi:hypothetical protein